MSIAYTRTLMASLLTTFKKTKDTVLLISFTGYSSATVLQITASKNIGGLIISPLSDPSKKSPIPFKICCKRQIKNDHKLIRKGILGNVFFFPLGNRRLSQSVYIDFYGQTLAHTHTCTYMKSPVPIVDTLPSVVTAVTYSYKQPHRVRKWN